MVHFNVGFCIMQSFLNLALGRAALGTPAFHDPAEAPPQFYSSRLFLAGPPLPHLLFAGSTTRSTHLCAVQGVLGSPGMLPILFSQSCAFSFPSSHPGPFVLWSQHHFLPLSLQGGPHHFLIPTQGQDFFLFFFLKSQIFRELRAVTGV